MPEGSLEPRGTQWTPYQDVRVGWWMFMSPLDEGTARLVERPAAPQSVCRCGTPLSRGARALEVRGLPPELQGFLEGRTFCSRRCVRAAFLEALSAINQLETPTAGQTVEDLGVTFAKLAFALGQALSPPR